MKSLLRLLCFFCSALSAQISIYNSNLNRLEFFTETGMLTGYATYNHEMWRTEYYNALGVLQYFESVNHTFGTIERVIEQPFSPMLMHSDPEKSYGFVVWNQKKNRKEYFNTMNEKVGHAQWSDIERKWIYISSPD
jgi:hypothetical protein